MGLLDKLKPTPRWKHADPAVRLEAVRELDDAAELAALAESDPDARVRRASIPRVVDAAVLGRVAGADQDPETRDRAADRLVALATAGPDEATAVAAVRSLADSRRLSAIARSEAADAVRAEALARITDQRALGGVARHARHEPTAAAALDRLTDREELTEVALHADHKEVATRAFERLIAPDVDLALLRIIETRATEKSIARRAKALIHDAEAAEAARLAAIEEQRRREAALCDAADQLASAVGDPAAARADLDRLSASFAALEGPDDAARARFADAAGRVKAAIVLRDREIAEAAERRRQRAEAIATREALCERVETLDGDDVLPQLEPIEEEWRSLTPLVGDGPEAASLAERFARAVAACRKRHEMGALLAETRAKYDALVAEAEGLSSQDDGAAAWARWQPLSREARGHAQTLAAALRPAADLDARLAAAGDALAARRTAEETARKAAADQARQQMVARLQRLTERARRTAEADTITLREGDRLMRDIGTALEDAGKLDAREIADAAAALRTQQEQVAPRIRELREMDDWRRFANAQRQEQLIAMGEAIVGSLKMEAEQGKSSDLAATARALKELHAKWQEAAEAPRNQAQRLWDRFRAATDYIRTACEPHFKKLRDERVAAMATKAAIVEEAESLAGSTDWVRTAARFQELQKTWQEGGPAVGDAGRELMARFRAASGAFFTRRRDDLSSKKKMWAENLARKEALCARVEALAESTEWDAASAEIKRLQAEWKTIGPVKHNKSEEIWNRFRGAADLFFQRYHNRHQILLATKLAEREAMVFQLEAFVAADPLPDDLATRVQELRTTWNRSVPIPSPEAKALTDRWRAALAAVVARGATAFAGTDLDPQAALRKIEKLVEKIEVYLEDAPDADDELSPTEALAARLRSALASNAMGGRAGDEARWRAAADAVKDAEAAWDRLRPIAGDAAREFEGRFRHACRRVQDEARRHVPARNGKATPTAPKSGKPHKPGDRPFRTDRRPPRETVGAV